MNRLRPSSLSNTDQSVAERLGPVVAALRSPLSHALEGGLTAVGQIHTGELQNILDELTQIPVRTPADALALTSITNDMLSVLAANADGNASACSAISTMAVALMSLRAHLAEASGKSVHEFTLLLPVAPPSSPSAH